MAFWITRSSNEKHEIHRVRPRWSWFWNAWVQGAGKFYIPFEISARDLPSELRERPGGKKGWPVKVGLNPKATK